MRGCRGACFVDSRRSGSTTEKVERKQRASLRRGRKRRAAPTLHSAEFTRCVRNQGVTRWYGSCVERPAVLSTTTPREQRVLQKDGFFRKREEKRDDNLFRSSQAVTTAPATAANTTEVEATLPGTSRKEAKLVVGPDIKLKGVEISDCDTLIVEGRVEATLYSRVLEITPHGVFQGTIAVDNAEIHGRFEGEL